MKQDISSTKTAYSDNSCPIFNDPAEYLHFREGNFLKRFFKRFFEWLSLNLCLKGIKDITNVCDCPCGPGRLFAYWKKKGYKITGIDLSPPMLEAAENELKNICYPGRTLLHDAFKFTNSDIEQPDMVACIRFLYYFDTDVRIRLLKSLAQFSKKYVLVQYKTSETLRGNRNARLKTLQWYLTAKQYITYQGIIDELEQAGLRCMRIIPKGDNSDRAFVLSKRQGTSEKNEIIQCDYQPYIFKHRKLLSQAAAVVAVLLLAVGALQYKRLMDPHEYAIECLVENYQDGDDVFFVNSDSDFEDLKTDEDLVVVSQLTSVIENILKNKDSHDYYFIIPVNEFELIKNKFFLMNLSVVKNFTVGKDRLIILSTEKHILRRRSSIDAFKIAGDKYLALNKINSYDRAV